MQVWKRAASFDPKRGEVATWLLTIARSRALDRRRAIAARARIEGGPEDRLAELPDGRGDAAAPAQHVECRDAVRSALALLPSDQRSVVELAFDGGLTHIEIADRLDQPLGTVKTRIRLGMIKLRELLKSWEGVE
jgi:RNA polymerase sigma-70 factor (ECF subfamily)